MIRHSETPVMRTLAECEDVVNRGFETFVEVGRALLEIRDNRLYRDGGFSAFDAYCRTVLVVAGVASLVTLDGGHD